MKLICPKCKSKFTVFENLIRCENGHCFDRAREGYYNLLLASSGGVHGDNKEMVDARRAFLDTGAYEPLKNRISELVALYADGNDVLDLGCGEGYYTDSIERAVSEAHGACRVYAFDISRDAVKRAAKRNKSLSLFVASAYDIPFATAGASVVVDMFSPLALDEISRVLSDKGRLVMAIPDRRHLYSLKKEIYDTPYENEVKDTALQGFSLIHEERLSYRVTLDSGEKIKSLFMMTPYAYRTGKLGRERVLALDSLTTEVEFVIFVYEKL